VAGAAHIKDASAPVIRASRAVFVHGVLEQWTLWWRSPPDSVCADQVSMTCKGIAFGEQGSLELVRERSGAIVEKMLLDSLFEDSVARLQKYEPRPSDGTLTVDSAYLAGRPVVDPLRFADYDHDGEATEFVLQINALAGQQPAVVVGVSTAEPKLHAFTGTSDPTKPIVLRDPAQWAHVRSATRLLTLIQITCGDHGAKDEEIVTIKILAGGGLDATRKVTPCRTRVF
jgi:hypothetical protein